MEYLFPLKLSDPVKKHLKHNYTPNSTQEDDKRFEDLLSTLGCPPLFTTLRVNTLKSDTLTVIELLTKEIEKNYKKRELPLPTIHQHPLLDDVIVIENKGPVQRQKVSKEVIVDLPCGMAVLRGADVFVQGILGAPPDGMSGDKVSVYADMNGKCLRGYVKPFNGEKLFVGNGILQFNREEMFCNKDPLSGVGVLMTEPLYEAPSLNDTCVDLIFPQNLPSIVCSHVLDPKPGEIILDMCASPGGKTTHLAVLMKNKGRLVAVDKTQQKIEKIQKHARQWDLDIIETYASDSTQMVDVGSGGKTTHLAVLMKNKGRLVAVDKTQQKIEKIQKHARQWDLDIIETYASDSTQMVDVGSDTTGGPPYPPQTFDRILLDGPCSALGQRPSAHNKMSLNSLKSYSTYQRKLIQCAVQLLKPNGTLVYSTCTINQEENEKQVVWALKTFPELALESQKPHLGQTGQECDGLTKYQQEMLQFYDPGQIADLTVNNDTIGFFIAKFRKRSS